MPIKYYMNYEQFNSFLQDMYLKCSSKSAIVVLKKFVQNSNKL